MQRVRGFEIVSYAPEGTIKPTRSTAHSAGYDFRAPEDIIIPPGYTVKIFTNIKAYMLPDEYLALHVRSSLGIKYNIVEANTVGIIDSDYYNNPDNEGNIIIALRNEGNTTIPIDAGERIVQGIFCKYMLADDDNATGTRTGGVGSTGK